MPVVETEKSWYATSSAVGGRYTPGSFFLGSSSVSRVGGQDLMSTTLEASLDFRSLITCKHLELLVNKNIFWCTKIFYSHNQLHFKYTD